jgi:hypothetical protein
MLAAQAGLSGLQRLTTDAFFAELKLAILW